MTKNKKPRKKYLLRKKREIAKYYQSNKKTYVELETQFQVPEGVVRTSLKMSDDLLNLQSDDPVLDQYKLNKSKHINTVNLDQYILNGIRKIRDAGGNVSYGSIVSLAKKYKEKRPDCKVNISSYFVRNFKSRNNIRYKTLCGEAKSAVLEKIPDFFKEYEIVRKDYDDRDIYNLDETGLFIKCFGNKSYVIKGQDDNKSVKLDKTRITLTVCFNKYGDEFTPLIIGKSANPRAFKNDKPEFFNLKYANNKSSWLTKDIFIRYLTEINHSLRAEERKILLLLDNFSGHYVSDFSNIKLFFFPPNTTSILQPLDLGIISIIKKKYKEYLNTYINSLIIDKDMDIKSSYNSLTLLDVCHWIRKSIQEVKPASFYSCWEKFLSMKPTNEIRRNRENTGDSEILIDDDSSCESSEEYDDSNSLDSLLGSTTDNARQSSIKFHLSKLDDLIIKEDKEVITSFMDFKHKYLASCVKNAHEKNN